MNETRIQAKIKNEHQLNYSDRDWSERNGLGNDILPTDQISSSLDFWIKPDFFHDSYPPEILSTIFSNQDYYQGLILPQTWLPKENYLSLIYHPETSLHVSEVPKSVNDQQVFQSSGKSSIGTHSKINYLDSSLQFDSFDPNHEKYLKVEQNSLSSSFPENRQIYVTLTGSSSFQLADSSHRDHNHCSVPQDSHSGRIDVNDDVDERITSLNLWSDTQQEKPLSKRRSFSKKLIEGPYCTRAHHKGFTVPFSSGNTTRPTGSRHRNAKSLFGSVEMCFDNICMLCGSCIDSLDDVVYCSRKACRRGMHVKCLLVCCSSSTGLHSTGSCLPTRHVYRTDTEMCGLCHLFVYELSSTTATSSSLSGQLLCNNLNKNNKSNQEIEEEIEESLTLVQTQELQMAEKLWHLRPNTSKTAEPLRATLTQMLRTLRIHIPTPKGVVVQAESYIWRVSAEAVKKRAKQMGLEGCSFRFSAAGFFEARIAAIVRFNQIAAETIGEVGLEQFRYPSPDQSVWSTPCALELRRLAAIQRRYGWPESLPDIDSTEENPQPIEEIPDWIMTRKDEDRSHIIYPPGPIFCVVEGVRNLNIYGNNRKGSRKKTQLASNSLSSSPLNLQSFNMNKSLEYQLEMNQSSDCPMATQRSGQQSSTPYYHDLPTLNKADSNPSKLHKTSIYPSFSDNQLQRTFELMNQNSLDDQFSLYQSDFSISSNQSNYFKSPYQTSLTSGNSLLDQSFLLSQIHNQLSSSSSYIENPSHSLLQTLQMSDYCNNSSLDTPLYEFLYPKRFNMHHESIQPSDSVHSQTIQRPSNLSSIRDSSTSTVQSIPHHPLSTIRNPSSLQPSFTSAISSSLDASPSVSSSINLDEIHCRRLIHCLSNASGSTASSPSSVVDTRANDGEPINFCDFFPSPSTHEVPFFEVDDLGPPTIVQFKESLDDSHILIQNRNHDLYQQVYSSHSNNPKLSPSSVSTHASTPPSRQRSLDGSDINELNSCLSSTSLQLVSDDKYWAPLLISTTSTLNGSIEENIIQDHNEILHLKNEQKFHGSATSTYETQIQSCRENCNSYLNDEAIQIIRSCLPEPLYLGEMSQTETYSNVGVATGNDLAENRFLNLTEGNQVHSEINNICNRVQTIPASKETDEFEDCKIKDLNADLITMFSSQFESSSRNDFIIESSRDSIFSNEEKLQKTRNQKGDEKGRFLPKQEMSQRRQRNFRRRTVDSRDIDGRTDKYNDGATSVSSLMSECQKPGVVAQEKEYELKKSPNKRCHDFLDLIENRRMELGKRDKNDNILPSVKRQCINPLNSKSTILSKTSSFLFRRSSCSSLFNCRNAMITDCSLSDEESGNNSNILPAFYCNSSFAATNAACYD